MTAAPISALYAAAATLLVVALALNVARLRRARRIGLGSGGDAELALATRAHGNAVEVVPLALVLLLLLELNGCPPVLLHGLGSALLLARLAHAQGLLVHGGGHSRGRFWGTLATWALLLAAAAGLPVLATGA
ncbi:MAG: MAPEG family protein [Halofilum sp. (in: g-proteobacteria)]|nr:MAPEG family protein [Halofilum sp. (in: g-proteobacteria)]